MAAVEAWQDRAARAMDADIARLDELLREELGLLRSGDVAQPTYAELAFGEEMDERGRATRRRSWRPSSSLCRRRAATRP